MFFMPLCGLIDVYCGAGGEHFGAVQDRFDHSHQIFPRGFLTAGEIDYQRTAADTGSAS